MSDIRDFTGKNRKFTGTEGIKVPEGTTGQRVSTTGTFRFNSTTGRFEGFDGTNFATVIAYPTITSFTPALLTNDTANIVITGLNFGTGNTASVFNISTAASVTANSTTIDSSTQITANFTIPTDGNYKVRITTAEGAIGESAGTLVVSDVPVFSTSAGSLGSANANVAGTFTIAASESATFSLISGSIPPGYSLNSSTGVISGTDTTTVSDTTFTFTIQATDAQSQTATREFSIFMDTFLATGGTVSTYGSAPAAYKVHTFTSPGTLSVTGSKSCDILLVGAGGSGGGYHAGAGGAGGMVVLTGNTITAGSYPISIPGTTPNPTNAGATGGNTTGFGQTAAGGGAGGSYNGTLTGGAGGSGGGGAATGVYGGGASNQGAVVSPRTGTVHGNAGGTGYDGPGPSRHAGGGGGGAGGAGDSGNDDVGNGGIGLQNAFRTGSNEYYAGGGGGGAWDGQRGTGGSGGGGNGTRYNNNEGDKNGSFYGGGGGGNGGNGGPYTGGTGNAGVVVIRYLT